MESPGSELSDYSSEDFPEDVKPTRSRSFDPYHEHPYLAGAMRPAKRPRLGTDQPPEIPPMDEEEIEISEDTDGSVPPSPNHPGMSGDDYEYGQEQVTTCKWEGCNMGDLGNMDKLVEHLHEDHIGTRQKKYSCEWIDCARKGIPHASGYALRAHMRSHTREKPFYCTLPECDRSFTRSDALAKHMRTVHETEALRPSDPVPKHHSSNPSNKFQRLRLVFGKNSAPGDTTNNGKSATPNPDSPSSAAHPGDPPVAESEYAHNNVIYTPDSSRPGVFAPVFPADVASALTPEESALPAQQLFRLLRRQLHWAQQEAEALKQEMETLEQQRKREWAEKELLFDNVMEEELMWLMRRGRERGVEPLRKPDLKADCLTDLDKARTRAITDATGKEVKPWWREETEGLAAEVMHDVEAQGQVSSEGRSLQQQQHEQPSGGKDSETGGRSGATGMEGVRTEAGA